MKQQQFYLISSVFIFLILFSIISCTGETDTSDSSIIKIAMREAGNQLLLRQQDSISIISPVIEKDEATYQLSFQKTLSFEPNELVTVIDSSFAMTSLSQNYRVEVIQCADQEVAYSYQMNVEEERTIIPCAGRFLPEDCYIIQVTFLDVIPSKFKKRTSIYVLIFGFIMYLIYLYLRKSKSDSSSEVDSISYSEIGSFHFYPEQNKLVKAATEISLSKKECELLELFVASPNQVIRRDELTKKVWEDNGVIVGRSLDTYISKLRKKLQDDSSIKLTNIHGVGYKLEVS